MPDLMIEAYADQSRRNRPNRCIVQWQSADVTFVDRTGITGQCVRNRVRRSGTSSVNEGATMSPSSVGCYTLCTSLLRRVDVVPT